LVRQQKNPQRLKFTNEFQPFFIKTNPLI